MTLVYKFKKEELENGLFVSRPRIDVQLVGTETTIEIPALIDSGCDITVIPEGIAKAIGIKMSGQKTELHAFRESSTVIQSKATIRFLAKQQRDQVRVNIPVLVVLKAKGQKEEDEIVLGVDGIFDAFEITFKKARDRIILKPINK